ncbi:MAG: DUF3995 domain-containing protein [Chloroflexi bacterium]|nr:DUF3995 domain-containing protein [Chloroflexota bacterium]
MARNTAFAAFLAAIFLLTTAAFQVWWALGGSWGLAAAWGGDYSDLPARLQIASAFSSIVLTAGAVIVLGRAGYRVIELPYGVLRWGTWAIVALTGLSALANFASSSEWERFLNAPIALLVALLCLAVARSPYPLRYRDDDTED